MDVTGLLAAALAVGVFPGGLYLMAAGRGAALAAGVPRLGHPDPATAAALAAATFCAALLPLPGAPAHTIPDPGGAASNLLALLLLGALAVALGTPARWDAVRAAAAVAATLPLLALGSSASTLSLATVAALPDPRHAAARGLAGLAAVLAAPALAGGSVALRGSAGAGAAAVAALAVLLGVAVGLPAGVAALPGVVVAALGVAAVAATAGCAMRGWPWPLARVAGVAAPAVAATATVLALVGGNS